MKQTPIFLTQYGLGRLLKEFAKRLGMDDSMADAMAQVHLQESRVASGWSAFIVGNCVGCRKAPETCEFLNPEPRHCMPGTTPLSVKAANAMVIELGKLESCPARVPEAGATNDDP